MTQPARSDRVLDNVVTAAVVTALADIATWTAVGPISVMKVGALVTVAQSGALPVIRFDLRPTYGSDTGRVNGKFGSFSFPAGGVAAGKTVSIESRGKVDAGQQVVCAVTTVGGAGSVIPFLEWETRSENAGNQAQAAGTVVIAPAEMGNPLLRRLLEESREDMEARQAREREELETRQAAEWQVVQAREETAAQAVVEETAV